MIAMTMELSDFKAYINEKTDTNDVLLEACLADAIVLLNKYVGEAAVPEEIQDRSSLIVAADLYERRKAPNGIVNQQFQNFDGVGQAPARIARDPLAGVYPLLNRWVLPW